METTPGSSVDIYILPIKAKIESENIFLLPLGKNE